MKQTLIKSAGILNLITALIHTLAGQSDLVNPLSKSNLTDQMKAEWIAVWHIVTVFLFATSYAILKLGFGKEQPASIQNLKFIGVLFILIAVPFIVTGLYFSVFAPQWVLLMPVGGLLLMGLRNTKSYA